MDSSGQNANPINPTAAPVEPVVESTNVTAEGPAVEPDVTIAQAPIEEPKPVEPTDVMSPAEKNESEQVTTGVDFANNTTTSMPVSDSEPVKEPETPAAEPVVEPKTEVVAEATTEPAAETKTESEPVVEPVVEPAPEVPETIETPEVSADTTDEKPAVVGAEAVAQELQANEADLSNIEPLEQNLQAEAAQAPSNKPAPSIANTILIVLIVLSALVLAASIIAFFVVG